MKNKNIDYLEIILLVLIIIAVLTFSIIAINITPESRDHIRYKECEEQCEALNIFNKYYNNQCYCLPESCRPFEQYGTFMFVCNKEDLNITE